MSSLIALQLILLRQSLSLNEKLAISARLASKLLASCNSSVYSLGGVSPVQASPFKQ